VAGLPKRLVLLGLGLFTLMGMAISLTSAEPYAETFDGQPVTPLAFDGVDFDLQVHERGSRGTSLPFINAQHGVDCAGPPATHAVSDVANSVFICRDHLMTALNGDEYGMIYLTPNRMLDFGTSGTVRFDVSTGDQSRRDWIDLWITPYADNLALPLQPDLPDAQGEPRNGIHLQQDFTENSWHLAVFRNGSRTVYGGGINANTSGAFVPDFARRDTMEVTITPGRVRLTMPAYGLVLVDQVVSALPFTQGVVQFGHHSYDPTKDGSGSPNTWHWDNFTIEPAIPFSITKAGGPNYIQNSTGTVTFPPAPAGAELRFSAVGPGVRVNGQVVAPRGSHAKLEQVASYSVPIPEGATSATVGVDESIWCGGHTCQAKDFHLWSLSSGANPTPSAPATNSATPTPPAIPSATLSPTAVPATPTAVATPTAPAIRRNCTLRWGSTTVESYGQLTQAECMARGQ
jgi:hypothetical protein